jgi:hypothetical protein
VTLSRRNLSGGCFGGEPYTWAVTLIGSASSGLFFYRLSYREYDCGCTTFCFRIIYEYENFAMNSKLVLY